MGVLKSFPDFHSGVGEVLPSYQAIKRKPGINTGFSLFASILRNDPQLLQSAPDFVHRQRIQTIRMTVTAIQTPHSTQTLAVLLEKDDISHALRHAVIGVFKRLRLPFDPRSPDIWITGTEERHNGNSR